MPEVNDDILTIQAKVHAYRDFQECVVTAVRWKTYGTIIEIDIDYTWEEDGSVRPDDGTKRIVTLTFGLVHEFTMHNRLTSMMISHPSSINWGFDEIAMLRVAHEIRVEHRSKERPTYRVTFQQEAGPWIEVVCCKMTITEREA